MTDLYHQCLADLRGIAQAAVEDNRRLRPREAGLIIEQQISELQVERVAILERLGSAETRRQEADRRLREAWEAQRVEVGARIRAEALLRLDVELVESLLAHSAQVLAPLCDALEVENAQLAEVRRELDTCDARRAQLEARPEVRALRRQEEAQYRIKLAEIQENFGQPRWTQAPTVSLAPVRDVLRRIGPAPRLGSLTEAEEELERLREAVERLDDWIGWPRDIQVALLAHFTARLRQLQVHYSSLDEQVATVFPRLSGFSRTHQPGFVYGLGRGHEPKHGQWVDDANVWWAELQERLGEKPQEARTARVVRRPERPEAADEATPAVPADWPLASRLRGSTVLMVGGDFTRDRLDRIEQAFGFRRLDHASGHEPRAVQSFAEAIERGRFDLVIILTRWLNHAASQRVVLACRNADVRFVQTDGYSTVALQQAFEHTLGAA